MPNRGHTDDELRATAEAYLAAGRNMQAAARQIGVSRTTFQSRLYEASRKGFVPTAPVMPGFRISQVTTGRDGKPVAIQQKPEHGEEFKVPQGQQIKGVSALVDADGREIVKWVKTKESEVDATASLRVLAKELKKDLPKIKRTPAPKHFVADLLNAYTITDLHLGMLAWAEQTRSRSWDIKIARQLILDWFSAAIELAEPAEVGLFAQLGDFFHYDSILAVTPTHRHPLDTDSRYQKIARVAIEVVRQIVRMLLERHQRVHLIWADANHDEATSAILREVWFAHFDNEPRITVDRSPDSYYAYAWGKTALFFHHGHRIKKVDDAAPIFVSRFPELYGKSKKRYGHVGHYHQDELSERNRLMPIERHRTLAPPDAHASRIGWLSEQDAKVITYHKEFGHVGRRILSPAMVERFVDVKLGEAR